MSRIVLAKVTRRSSADGVEFFQDDVPIGAEYLADLDTRHPMQWADETGKVTQRESVLIFGVHSEHNRGYAMGYVPTELLEFLKL